MKRKTRIVLGLSSAMFTVAGAAHAQTGDGAAGADAAVYADDIIVTAQKRRESIQDVPIAIQAFSAQSLQEKGVRNIQDFAQYTPNVTIISPTGAGGPPNITIRGVGLNDFNSNNAGPNGFYVDEMYISAPSAQGVSFFDVDRVEVLKGPQGTLYGRNSSGGAVNIITARPTDVFAARAHAEYGSFDTVNLEGYLSGPLTSTLSARISGVYNYSAGFAYNRLTGKHENGANNGAVRGQLLWTPGPDLKVLLKTQYYRSVARPAMYKPYGVFDPQSLADPNGPTVCSVQDVYAARCVDLFGYSSGTDLLKGDWNRQGKARLTDWQTSLRIDKELGGDLSFVSLSGYDRNKRFHPEDSDGGPNRLVELDYGVESKTFTQELRLAQSREGFNWVAGVYYLTEVLKQDQPAYALLDADVIFGAPGAADGLAFKLFTRNRQRTDAYAVFGQADYELLTDLTLTAGARYTWERRSFRSNIFQTKQLGGMDNFGPPQDITNTFRRLSAEKFNWRLGLNYKLDRDVMLYGSVATGFKSGGFSGGFLDQDPVKRLKQLEPFDPETVTAYEVGVKSSLLDRRVTLNLSAFYNSYKKQQVQILVPNSIPPVIVLDNAKKSRIYGVEGDITVRPVTNVTLTASMGYLNSKVTDFAAAQTTNDYTGNRLALTPKFATTLSAAWEIPVGDGSLTLKWDSNYRTKQFSTIANSPYTAFQAYWLHNARISYAINDRWEVAGYVRNLANRKYLVWPSDLIDPFGVITTMPGAPRSFGGEVNVKF